MSTCLGLGRWEGAGGSCCNVSGYPTPGDFHLIDPVAACGEERVMESMIESPWKDKQGAVLPSLWLSRWASTLNPCPRTLGIAHLGLESEAAGPGEGACGHRMWFCRVGVWGGQKLVAGFQSPLQHVSASPGIARGHHPFPGGLACSLVTGPAGHQEASLAASPAGPLDQNSPQAWLPHLNQSGRELRTPGPKLRKCLTGGPPSPQGVLLVLGGPGQVT